MKRAALLAALLTGTILLNGCSGSTGPIGPSGPTGSTGATGTPGAAGEPGLPGLNAGADLPGLVLTIKGVSGASGADGTFQVGDNIAVTFTVKNNAGEDIPISKVDYGEVYVAGPTSNYQQILENDEGDLLSAVSNGDGTYTFTFEDPVPMTYPLQDNESNDIPHDPGDREPKMSGLPLVQGTYTLGMAMYKMYTIDGTSYRDAGNAVKDFLFGGATTIDHREVVLQADCNQCHTHIQAHGGFRKDVRLCVLCHTAGAEDLPTTPPSTPGRTINFRVMIHKIHKGVELPNVEATANGTDPYLYTVIGYRGSVNNFSDVEFPAMPGGTGFNEQTRNCDACHGGAAQGDAYYMKPSRVACGSCHDDLNFDDPNFPGQATTLDDTKAAVSAGTLTQAQLTDPNFRTAVMPSQADDTSCLGCHADDVPALGVRNAHIPPLKIPDSPGSPGIIDLKAEITGVTGGTGPNGTFQPGDVPMVTFQFTDGAGNAVAAEDLSGINLVMSGPTGNYQKIIPAGDSSTVSASGLTGTGPFTYGIGVIPSTYPAQLNDDKRDRFPTAYPGYTGGDPFTFAGGWGELKGRDLDAGTYTIGLYAYRKFTRDSTTYTEASRVAVKDVLVSVGMDVPTKIVPHTTIVSDVSCNQCHKDLRMHGNTRRGVQLCVLCHTAGAEDKPRKSASLFEAPQPDTIDFRVLIHKFHNAENLDVVKDGGIFDIVGYGGTPEDFSDNIFPAMPGGAENCAKCHVGDDYMQPTERDDVRIWMKTCTACHDSDAAKAHVSLMTFGSITTGDPATNAVESCEVCHGTDADFAVAKEHKVR